MSNMVLFGFVFFLIIINILAKEIKCIQRDSCLLTDILAPVLVSNWVPSL